MRRPSLKLYKDIQSFQFQIFFGIGVCKEDMWGKSMNMKHCLTRGEDHVGVS